MTFSEFGLNPALLRAVDELGYAQPTPIQQDTIQPIMEGRDVLACAATGSGKTAAFLLPILHRLVAAGRKGGVRVLVLSPTRELAAQIDEDRQDLAKHTRQTGAAVFGGVGMAPQVQAFRTGVDVMVATPGRLLDHLQHPYARLDQIEVLVLDEADRMLDMGFLPDIRRVLSQLPAKRQTLLFSATMPQPIVELAREMQHQPVRFNIERQAKPAAGITHAVYPVGQQAKSGLLTHLLNTGEMQSVVVFTRTKHRADRLHGYLTKQGVSCARIHGNRSQGQRTEALAGFKRGEFRVLVATDIAARGIDVEALSHVVNFDVPHVPEDYIHRVGRTARAEATGDAFTFVSPEEMADLRAIEKALGQQIPRRTVTGFDPHAGGGEQLEIPLAERIAAIRARKAEERARAAEKAARRAAAEAARGQAQTMKAAAPRRAPKAAPMPENRPAGPDSRPGNRRRGRRGGSGPSGQPAQASGPVAAFRPVRGA